MRAVRRHRRAAWRGIAFVAGVAAVAITTLQVAHRLDAHGSSRATSQGRAQVASNVLAGDDWNDRIRSETFWTGGRRSNAGSPQGDASGRAGGRLLSEVPRDTRHSARSQASRTVCVRLCDGFVFPISASTAYDDLDRDALQCERSCSSPARLFTQRSASDDLSDLIDLKGQPYTKLKTANLFRTSWDESCKCKPHPWEQAALDRHRVYALEDQRRKGNTAVVAELTQLRARVRSAALDERRSASGLVASAADASKRGRATPFVEVDRGVAGAPVVLLAGPETEAANVGLADDEAARARSAPRPRSRQAAIAQDGIMRLGTGDPARASSKRSASSVAAGSTNDWVRRTFGQN